MAVAVALLGAAGTDRYEWSLLLMMGLALIMELLAVVALLWIVAWQPEVRGRQILRLVIVLWGTTAFGVVHVYIEHVIMICRVRRAVRPVAVLSALTRR